jgi:alkylation response protein AidB-like acyl-CoA dehydrogenase
VTRVARGSLDLAPSAEEEAFRAEARAWLAANVPRKPLPSMDTEAGFARHREWERTLHAGGWAVVAWPPEHGGRGVDLLRWLAFEEEYYRSGAPLRVNQNGLFLLGPTLLEYGTPAQRERFLGPMAAGDEIWAQGWSEPDAGSDMASIRTRARPAEDGGYVVDGQKIWVSRGAYADWMFGLVRSDPASERHHGLTFMLIPLAAEGVTVRPIRQLDGHAGFAEVFLDEVHVPESQIVGAPGEGWAIAMATAGFERGLLLRSPGRFLAAAERLMALFAERGEAGDTRMRERVTRAWMNAEAHRLYALWTVSRVMDGHKVGSEASLNKLFWSELDIDLHETALELLDGDAELAGGWMDGYLFSLSGPIYAGTNQIQRNIIADRVLRLPRS